MKPIKPKYTSLVKAEFNISDRSKEIIKQYANYTKFSESEIVDRLITEIMDDTDFVIHLKEKRYNRKINNIIFQNTPEPVSAAPTVISYVKAD